MANKAVARVSLLNAHLKSVSLPYMVKYEFIINEGKESFMQRK